MKAAPAYKKYEIIQEMSKGMRSIQLLCKIAEVSRSGYYKWLKRQSNPSPKEIEDKKIKNKIVECYKQVKDIYGYRRITVWLKMKHGIVVNHKRVQRLMNRMKLKAIIRKKRPYFLSKEAYVVSKNYLNRDFKAEQPNEKWVTDITYLIFNGKKLYLSAIKDLYNNEIVAYHISHRQDIQLVIDTLNKAKKQRNVKGILLQSDKVSNILHTNIMIS